MAHVNLFSGRVKTPAKNAQPPNQPPRNVPPPPHPFFRRCVWFQIDGFHWFRRGLFHLPGKPIYSSKRPPMKQTTSGVHHVETFRPLWRPPVLITSLKVGRSQIPIRREVQPYGPLGFPRPPHRFGDPAGPDVGVLRPGRKGP